MKTKPGRPYPLGATYDGYGVNFSLFSEVAERAQLCLFDESGHETQIDLPERTAFCWHGYIYGLSSGQRYGYRVHGPWEPAQGHLCCPAKLLLDPYAKAIEGQVRWDAAVFPVVDTNGNGPPSETDTAAHVPKSIIADTQFDWEDEQWPDTPWHETIIYEMHVKGFTARHPNIPESLRGTYAGLAHPAAIEHLQQLGITAVELLPVQQFVHEKRLVDLGLRNYWGYSPIGYFAPHNGYASSGQQGQQINEFKQMVKALHRAGIEVILDVVFNHTAEGNHLGPVLCFKGIDNAAYYRLNPEDRRQYLDFIGCGNALNMAHARVTQLIMDSLRYWVLQMRVDGFRFDAAAALARELYDVDYLSAFFDIIQQDPVISQVKLIAEPWDLGDGGYQVGNFPVLWAEWNGKYRDTVRRYWRGDKRQLGNLAQCLTGSSDLYQDDGRQPFASINFVTCHDGFTLQDLVSYQNKHNDANGEENRDGMDDNLSSNHGVEGATDNPEIVGMRNRQKRNFLATLFLSQGVPMLLAGDELGRTQGGNNNAYCQDSELSWVDWDNSDDEFMDFVVRLIHLRKQHPAFQRRKWFKDRNIWGPCAEDICWYQPSGEPMEQPDWDRDHPKSLGVYLNGRAVETNEDGQAVSDNDFYLAFNACQESVIFRLPSEVAPGSWRCVLDTSAASVASELPESQAGATFETPGRCLILLEAGVSE